MGLQVYVETHDMYGLPFVQQHIEQDRSSPRTVYHTAKETQNKTGMQLKCDNENKIKGGDREESN
jgi:flagellar basal body rod protein FlgF